jgi:hypothetical protein
MRKQILGLALLVVAGLPAAGYAQEQKFDILDNSFFVEEAFNQDRGIFQNIFSWTRDRRGGWNGTFTQEWPVPTITNQLSYTIPFAGGASPTHFGGVLLNYRLQVAEESATRPAFSPRFSVILPTGREIDDSDRPGVQFNLPVSKQVGDFYVHLNAGATWLHGVPSGDGLKTNLMSPAFAGSVIWNTRPYLNLMLESVLTLQDTLADSRQTSRQHVTTISPGARGGWTLSDQQIILGTALPVTFTEGEQHSTAFLVYFSYELPFTSRR